MNRKAFLLVDSLITVAIVSCMSLLCFGVYKAVNNYKEGYKKYKEETSSYFENIYNSLGECEKCIIEEDLYPLEQ